MLRMVMIDLAISLILEGFVLRRQLFVLTIIQESQEIQDLQFQIVFLVD